MRLDELIRDIKDTSLRHVLVNEFGEGDIYEYLNSGEHKYPCVFLTVTGLSDVGYNRVVNITLFYVDRLTSDQSNRTQLQSVATDVLSDIIYKFESTNVNYTLFTEKFSDLCAGAYAEFNATVEFTVGCEQNFTIRSKFIEKNGVYNVEDFDEVEVNVEVEGSGDGKIVLFDGTKFGYSTLTEIPEYYDFSEVTDFYRMFYQCDNLISIIPIIDTSKGTNFSTMFSGCPSLTTVGSLDISNGTNFQNMFYNCYKLENISFVGSINYSIDFSYSTLLTYDSIKSILTACSNTTRISSKTLKFSCTIADNNGELAALIADCNIKKWTISGLILE